MRSKQEVKKILSGSIDNLSKSLAVFYDRVSWTLKCYSEIFVWFWYQGNGGLVEWAWGCSFAIFGRVWKG